MMESEHNRILGVGFFAGRIQIMRVPEELMHNPEEGILHPNLKVSHYGNPSEVWYNKFFELCTQEFKRRIDRNESESVQFALRK